MKLDRLKMLVIFSGVITVPQISQANQILKCTDRSGVISYHNNKSSSKGLNCTGTNLATIDKIKAPDRPVNSKVNNSNSENLSTEKVSSYEQEIRNQKRVDLLRNELEQEKKQLLIISDMINKTNKQDESQIKQLEGIQSVHKNNINTLEKELKIDTTDFSKLKSTSIPGLGIVKKNNSDAPKFQIEGVEIDKNNVPTSLAQDNKNSNDKSNGLPSLELMQKNLKNLNNQREGKQTEQDSSQHIQIKRREIPGMKVSQSTLEYEPLPTPLSVPDFNIGK